jgi:hypothetical protein
LHSYQFEALRLPAGIDLVPADVCFTLAGVANNLPTEAYAFSELDQPHWNTFDGHIVFIGRSAAPGAEVIL